MYSDSDIVRVWSVCRVNHLPCRFVLFQSLCYDIAFFVWLDCYENIDCELKSMYMRFGDFVASL